MKRFFVLVIIIQLLTGGWFAVETAKAIFIRDHFVEHQNQNPEITWAEFLLLHYANPAHHEKDHDQHSKLPLLGSLLTGTAHTVPTEIAIPIRLWRSHIVTVYANDRLLAVHSFPMEHPPC